MTQRFLAEKWRSYAEQVLPDEAPTVQRVECRRAFYAGAVALWSIVNKHLSPDEEPTDSDLVIMRAIVDELQTFGRGVGSDDELLG
jgi:hypothetical protein